MSVTVVPAKKRYKPDCGDLVCGFESPESEKYLETPDKFPVTRRKREAGQRLQSLPLCLIDPHPWKAVEKLGIDATPIKCAYKCPYTDYTFFSIVPATLVSTDLEDKWGNQIRKPGVARHEYVLDHDYHWSMWKEKVFDLGEIGTLLLGSGYTYGTGIWDGSRSMHSTIVNLDNGDMLWVYFWIWFNK